MDKKTQQRIIDESLKKNSNVVSATDLTGLMSSMPENFEQSKALKDIYPIQK
ncbi:MAG: hypothetical protein FWE29_05275 [Defluviitaleaceae bacterium]|nr:hypothetical protein [Defluviitaleaceae bacterium]